MRLIFQDRFWVVHIQFVRIVKLKLLAQFPLDHLAHHVVSTLFALTYWFSHMRLMLWSLSPHNQLLQFYCLLLLLLLLLFSFFTPALSDGFSQEIEWQQVSSRTLLSILGDVNNAVVWMVSTRSHISKSFSRFINTLVTVSRAPITIGINVTFMLHSFFNSPTRSRYLSFFSLSFNFTLWLAKTAILQVLLFYWLLQDLVVWQRLGDTLVSQNLR